MRGRFAGLNALWTRTDGVSALEFTAVTPVVLLLLFGAFEFAQVFWIDRKSTRLNSSHRL